MSKTVKSTPLMLACNDYRNGQFEGLLRGVQLTDEEILNLETCLVDDEDIDELAGLDIVFDPQNRWFKVANDYTVPILDRKNWVGNWCWDCVLVELPELVKFLNWLMQTQSFYCVNGIDTLHDAWHNMKPIDEECLQEIIVNA